MKLPTDLNRAVIAIAEDRGPLQRAVAAAHSTRLMSEALLRERPDRMLVGLDGIGRARRLPLVATYGVARSVSARLKVSIAIGILLIIFACWLDHKYPFPPVMRNDELALHT